MLHSDYDRDIMDAITKGKFMETVIGIKLNSGFEIIGKVDDCEDLSLNLTKELYVTDAMFAHPQEVNGQLSLNLMPLSFFSASNNGFAIDVNINRSHIVFTYTPRQEAIDHYNSATSRIVKPSSSGIII